MPDEISRDEDASKVVRPRFRMGLKPTALLRHTAKVRLARGLAQNDTGRDFAEWGRGGGFGRGTRQPCFTLAFTTDAPHIRSPKKLRYCCLPRRVSKQKHHSAVFLCSDTPKSKEK